MKRKLSIPQKRKLMIESGEVKRCNLCLITKLVKNFPMSSPASGGLFGYQCKECKKDYNKRRYQKELRENPERVRMIRKAWASSNPAKRKGYGKKFRDKVRLAVITAYGGKCKCCGEKTMEFLSMDHMKGNGKEHRKSIGGHFYPFLLNNGFPKGFQVLCHNCNLAKGFYGSCPHSRGKK